MCKSDQDQSSISRDHEGNNCTFMDDITKIEYLGNYYTISIRLSALVNIRMEILAKIEPVTLPENRLESGNCATQSDNCRFFGTLTVTSQLSG